MNADSSKKFDMYAVNSNLRRGMPKIGHLDHFTISRYMNAI